MQKALTLAFGVTIIATRHNPNDNHLKLKANLCTPAKVEQFITAQSTINHDGTYVFQNRLTLTAFRLRLRRLRLGYFIPLYVNLSYFTLVTWLNGILFDEL
jgi:hypothetical protein